MTKDAALQVFRDDIARRESMIGTLRADNEHGHKLMHVDTMKLCRARNSERIVEIRKELDLLEEVVLIVGKIDSLL